MLIKYISPQIPFTGVSSFGPTLTQHRLFLCLLFLLLPLIMKGKVKQRERKRKVLLLEQSHDLKTNSCHSHTPARGSWYLFYL